MILGALVLILGNVALLLASRAIVSRLRLPSASLRLLACVVVRLLLMSALVLAAGLTGTLTPAGLGIPCAIVLMALLAFRENRIWTRPRLPEAGAASAALAAAVVVRLLLQVWFFSPHLGDPLAYHLPKIAEWVRAGAFTREMGVHAHAPFPAGFELIETWWVVFLRHDLLIELAGAEFLVLAAVGTYALAETVGLRPRAAFFAGLAFVLVPGLHLSATSCLNDVPAAAMLVATFALAAAKASPVLILTTVCLGLGIKPTYGFALPGVALLIFLCRRDPGPPERPPRGGWVLPAVSMAVGVFWYARNLAWYGNPFHPLGTRDFDDPTPVQFGARGSSLFANLSNLVNARIYDHSAVPGANVDDMAGWGGVAFAGGLAALIPLIRTDGCLRRLAAAFGVSLVCVLAFVQDDPWCLKYVFFFPALLCIAAAAAMDRWSSTVPIAGMALALAFAATFFSYDLRLPQARELASQPWRTRSAAVFPYGELGAGVADDAVGYYGSSTGASYLLYRPDFSRRVVFLRATAAPQLLEEMSQAAVGVLFAPSPTSEQKAVLAECVRRNTLSSKGPYYRRTSP